MQPAGCVSSRIDTTQPAIKIDGGHGSDADKVAQQALDFCELFVHGMIIDTDFEHTVGFAVCSQMSKQPIQNDQSIVMDKQ